ncbi:MAG: hypothetical protein WCF54_11945 [Terracidiphilus sp.]
MDREVHATAGLETGATVVTALQLLRRYCGYGAAVVGAAMVSGR